MSNKKVLMILDKNGFNGGPNNSQLRIANSVLKEEYDFEIIYYDRGRKYLNPFFFLKFVREIKKHNPDIVHFSGLQLDGYINCLACRFAGIKKKIIAIRGSSNEAIVLSKFKRFWFNKLEISTLKKATCTYGVSNYVSNWENVKKYSKKHFGTIYNLGDVPHHKTQSSFRKEFNIPEEAFIVVSTGRIIEEKGFDTLKDVINEIQPKGNLFFVIVGDGNYKKTMLAQIVKTENVIFTGYRKDVLDILNESNVFVLCTKHETLGNSIIEALYSHLPVIVSNVGGIPEFVSDGKNGYLVNPTDVRSFVNHILNLYENPSIYEKLKKQTTIINNIINNDQIIEQLRTLYETC